MNYCLYFLPLLSNMVYFLLLKIYICPTLFGGKNCLLLISFEAIDNNLPLWSDFFQFI